MGLAVKKIRKSLKKRMAWAFLIVMAVFILFCGIGNSQELLTMPVMPVSFGGAIFAPVTVEVEASDDGYIGALPDIKPATFYVVPRDIETSA